MKTNEILKELKEIAPAIKILEANPVAKNLVITFVRGIDLAIERSQKNDDTIN